MDLSHPERFPIFSQPLDITFLCAGIANLATCEKNPTGTSLINVDNTVAFVQSLIATGSWVVFLSTNLVFDGSLPERTADTLPSPTCEYGRQKARAEKRLLTIGPSVAVLRQTKVVHPDTEPFSTWYQALSEGKSVEAFTDKVCAPLSIQSTVTLLLALARKRPGGVLQASASRDLTYAEAATILAQHAGSDSKQVRPVLGKEQGIPDFFLPRHTTLETSRQIKDLGWVPPEPEKALLEGLQR